MNADTKRGMAVMMFAVGVDLLGLSIILPILPDIGASYDASPTLIGFIYTAYALAQTISNPLTGRLSDSFGRRAVLLFSLLGSIIGFLFMGLTLQFKWPMAVFLVFRFVAGAFGSTPPVAKAYIADVTSIKDRPFYYSIFGSVLGGSFAIGPAIGGALSEISLAAPLYAGAAMSFVGLVFAAFFFKNPTKEEIEAKLPVKVDQAATVTTGAATATATGASASNPLTEDKIVVQVEGETTPSSSSKSLSNTATSTPSTSSSSVNTAVPVKPPTKPMPHLLVWLWFCQFFTASGFAGYLSVFPLLIKYKYQFGGYQVGLFFTYTSAVFVIVQLFLFSRIVKKIGKHTAAIIGSILFSIGLLLIPFAPSDVAVGVPLTCLFLFPVSVGFGLISPAIPSLISRYADPKKMGISIGTGDAFDSAARVVAPLMLTGILEASIKTMGESQAYFAPFLTAAGFGFIVAIIMVVMLYYNRSVHRKEDMLSLVPPPESYLISAIEMEKVNAGVAVV